MRLEVSENTIRTAVYADNVYEHHFIDGEHRYISGPLIDDEIEFVLSTFEFDEKDSVAMGCAADESEFVHFQEPVTPDSDQVR